VDLIKTAAVYKASQTDFLLSNGDKLAETTYKVLGKELTNSLIECTGGRIFTSGPTIKSLIQDVDKFYTERGVWSCANFVLEGLEKDDPVIFDQAKDYLIETLDRCTNKRHYSHIAIKLTGLGHMDMFKIYHRAQHLLLRDMFKGYAIQHSDGSLVLTRDGAKQFLKDYGYEFTEAELDEFFELAKFEYSKYAKDEIGQVEFYENVHAHYVYSDKHNTAIIKRICESVGLKKNTRKAIERFQARVIEIIDRADGHDTKVCVDAEQTYIQKALDSFTRQLQTHYHKDGVAFILNGYQSYLKSSPYHIRREIDRCRTLGIGFGIKLIRGAYMEEERRIAKEKHYPSPVWDTIDETHASYNGNVDHILNNLDPERGKSKASSFS
jgi:proline dehydrogenase